MMQSDARDARDRDSGGGSDARSEGAACSVQERCGAVEMNEYAQDL